MIKHIISTKCNMKCEYCITKNLKVRQKIDWYDLADLYSDLSKQDDSIMITGGEPTINKYFEDICGYAVNYFHKIYLTTSNFKILDDDWYEAFDGISFSLHGRPPKIINKFTSQMKVFASILDSEYYPNLPHILKEMGYSGLTINEEQREGKEFNTQLPTIKDFSIKVNRRGRCMNDTIILPNLEVINDYGKYL